MFTIWWTKQATNISCFSLMFTIWWTKQATNISCLSNVKNFAFFLVIDFVLSVTDEDGVVMMVLMMLMMMMVMMMMMMMMLMMMMMMLMMMLMVCQPEKLKPEAGMKSPRVANVNVGMTLVSTKNLAKMGSKVFAAPVCFCCFNI